MRSRAAALFAVLLMIPLVALPSLGSAAPSETYDGPYFGAGNLPPGCEGDMPSVWLDEPQRAVCHHMRTGLNALDSPQIDVLILAPVSPTVERDMRIMRQSIQMWEGGIHYLAGEMGLDWLQENVDFHITVDTFDPDGGGGEFTTYPIVDPEIVVIASNPVGGVGIGIDPLASPFGIEGPCHGVPNAAADFDFWDSLPGFDRHHEGRSGTYTEDCGGSGGNVCFAVNGAIDPEPQTVDVFSLFDLVSHEVGHCLTLGHVGDGMEGTWGKLPSNDIMAYSADPPGLNKCVSTLDVEAFATRMSNYLDTNGDGVVDGADVLTVNDHVGEGGNRFHVQHPSDHHYASSTGDPTDCPQPDLGPVPGERTDWTPEPVPTTETTFTVTSPADGTHTSTDTIDVTGTVERAPIDDGPTVKAGSADDADDDASSPVTEIQRLDVEVTSDAVTAAIQLEQLWPSTDVASATSYSLAVNGRVFDSFVRYPVDSNPMTWDTSAGGYAPAGTSTWDVENNRVLFEIPIDYLRDDGPYYVSATANIGGLTTYVVDDEAPDGDGTIGVAGNASVVRVGRDLLPYASTQSVTVGSGTFFPEQSTLGEDVMGHSQTFTLALPDATGAQVTLDFTDPLVGADLDLYVTGDGYDSGAAGATIANPETVTVPAGVASVTVTVEPYLVTDPVEGTSFTVTALVTSADGDDTADSQPTGATVEVLDASGVLLGSQGVDPEAEGGDTFAITVPLVEGPQDLTIRWMRNGRVVAAETRTVTRTADEDGDGVADSEDVCPGHDDALDSDGDGTPDGCDSDVADGTDRDGDGDADDVDNCVRSANPDQADTDGDGEGDACDHDIDGDGHHNRKEEAHGSDPYDAESTPATGRDG